MTWSRPFRVDENHYVHNDDVEKWEIKMRLSGKIVSISALLIMPMASMADTDSSQVQARYMSVQQARPDTVPFMFDVTHEELSNGEGEAEFTATGQFRVNPAMPVGSRVTILTAPEGESEAFSDQVEEFNSAEDLGKLFWCGSDAATLEENAAKPADQVSQAEIISETDEIIVFRLAPPETIVLDREDYESNRQFKAAKKAASKIAEELTYSLETGQQTHSRTYNTGSFKLDGIAKVNNMNNDVTCEYLPEAEASFRQLSVMSLEGKAFAVVSFNTNTRTSISNLQPLPTP